MQSTERRYSTGLRFLDSRLRGGIPVGKLLTLTAPAHTQSELLLYHLATSNPVRYVSTMNPDEVEILDAIDSSAIGPPIDFEFTYAKPATILETTEEFLEEIRPESILIIDPIDGLERADREQYIAFVNALKQQLRVRDCIGVFHGLETPPIPDARRVTLQRADHVWRLEQLDLSRAIKTRLLITKARGDRAQSDPIPLNISDHVRIDTSRRIS